MSESMPEWPTTEEYRALYGTHGQYMEHYERARSDAALARLMVAVEALHGLSQPNHPGPTKQLKLYAVAAREALATIGPLPLPTTMRGEGE